MKCNESVTCSECRYYRPYYYNAQINDWLLVCIKELSYQSDETNALCTKYEYPNKITCGRTIEKNIDHT